MQVQLQGRSVAIPVLGILAVALVAILLALNIRVARVQADEIGVSINNLTGSITIRTTPGATIYNGLMTDFYTLDNTVQAYTMVDDDSVNVKTEDGSDVRLDILINYRLVQDARVIADAVVPEAGLGQVAIDTGSGRRSSYEYVDAYKAKWIRDYARSICRYIFGELQTDAFYQSDLRDQKARDCETELNMLLRPHGIEVVKVVPDRFEFYREYEEKIAQKKEADQEAEKQEELARAAIERQKRREVEAQAEMNVAVEEALGQLRKELLAAQAEANKERLNAEAYAIEIKKDADARFYEAQNEAQSIVAGAEAEAEGLTKLAASLAGNGADKLVRLEYAKRLRSARINGVPYATDPRIQKVEIDAGALQPPGRGSSRTTGAGTSNDNGGER
jgi:regulator of protease activity HflC (stomatin/prohibitin superfamily)